MRTGISSTILGFVLGAMGLAWQTPFPTSSPRVHVVGCIRRSEPAPTATAGSTAVASETKYILTDITLANDSSTATNPAEAVIAENVNRYRLDDSADRLLVPHVGDRVEVTGTIVVPSKSPAGRGAGM